MARGVNKLKPETLRQESLILKAMHCFYSIPEISEKTGVPRSTIYFRLRKLGVLRPRGDGVRLAASKGRMSANKGVARAFTEEWKRNIRASSQARGAATAKGTSLKPNGYVEITRGVNKHRGEHRVVMEAHLGRPLRTDEHVHHIDHNRSNNDVSNLEVMSASGHMSLHATEMNKHRLRDRLGRYK